MVLWWWWWRRWCGVCLTCGGVLQLEQEKTLGICQLSLGSKTGSQQRRYFRDNRFKRFKEAITDFRGFNSISPGETWAFYLGARRSSLTSGFLTSPPAPHPPTYPLLRLEVLYDIWGPWPRGSETEKGAEIRDNQRKQGKGGDITEIKELEIIREIK